MFTLEQLIQRCRKNLEEAHKGACDCWIACQTAFSENRITDYHIDLNDSKKFIELYCFFHSKLAVFTKMQQDTPGETLQEEMVVMTGMQ